MIFIETLICILLAYLCVYALIARVCKCVEHCATARAFSKFRESGIDVSLDKLRKTIDQSTELWDEEKREFVYTKK